LYWFLQSYLIFLSLEKNIADFILRNKECILTLYYKVLFMSEQNQHLESLQDIRQLMQKSSRFISLSGLSGIAAGVCALVGAWLANDRITHYGYRSSYDYNELQRNTIVRADKSLEFDLIMIGGFTFIIAFAVAFVFTYLRSRKTGVPIWGHVARKVMINVAVPMLVGGLIVLKLVEFGVYGMIAPSCLLFYGLALINASKYTFPEIKWMGYAQLVLGALNLWMIGYGLYFWALGFGVLHILYGFIMWWRNERQATI
jgi:hypothetical protein